MINLVLARGTRIIVRHGKGEALASVQRFVFGAKTFKVRKWRTSKKMWSSVITIPMDDYLHLAPTEGESDEGDQSTVG